jgi:hypothetical protein
MMYLCHSHLRCARPVVRPHGQFRLPLSPIPTDGLFCLRFPYATSVRRGHELIAERHGYPGPDLLWVLRQLGGVPALASLPSEQAQVDTCRRLRLVQLARGDAVCEQGTASEGQLVILLRGVLRVQIDGVDR